VNLASGAIVEDMKLGIDLAIAGSPAIFCADTLVASVLPQQTSAANSQRTRWEHGHLQSIGIYAPQLLRAALLQRRWDLLLMAWDLCIPPLSLMVMLWVVTACVTGIAAMFGLSRGPVVLTGIAGLMLLTAILGAWQRVGRTILPLGDLLRVPLYVVAKLPLYLRFINAPQQSWERTARDEVAPEIALSSKN
jgi:cellulose synthase/poly-beta-1,6-N-acetylglucosamine synthase-like glycosyltransferase